jgi:uncharacterized membrane protein
MNRVFRAELLIANVLRYGVLLCLCVVGVGLALRFAQPGNADTVAALLSGLTPGEYHPPATVAALGAGLARLDADTVIALGLLLLIALPVVRVALTTLIFLRERDWAFVGITLVVLAVLFTGIFLGNIG